MRTSLRSARAFPLNPARFLWAVLLFTLTAAVACAQNYTSIVVFGDSLSDTGNVAQLTENTYGLRIPGPIADYTDGRFTDGYDTLPGALNYAGVWVEQLAAALPNKPAILASLNGGTNYAYGFADTDAGTAPLALGPYTVTIQNMGQQVTDYLATHPKINAKTLFIVWGGANDVLSATTLADITNAAVAEAVDVERLIQAGATQILVPNLPPLGLVPRLNGSRATSVPGTAASVLFDSVLALALDIVSNGNRGKVHVFQLDVFTLFKQVVAAPASHALVNVTGSSQGVYTLNPDTYLFWDDLHPTTKGHDILALAAAELLNPEKCWGSTWPYPLSPSERACNLH